MSFLLFLGDIGVLYASLFLMLLLRYGAHLYDQFIDLHFLPFSIIFALWLLVFFIAGLYELRLLRNNLDFFKILFLTIAVNAVLSILFFYLIPLFGITPKTNLFIFIGIFIVLEAVWRNYFNKIAAFAAPASEVTLVGDGETGKEIYGFLKENPQLGYKINNFFKENLTTEEINGIKENFRKAGNGILVAPRQFKKNPSLSKILYEFLTSGITVKDETNFYEDIFRRTPLSTINEEWILENFSTTDKFYDGLKRGGEFLGTLILGIVFLPLMALINIMIKIFSPGPAIYKQTRVGKNGREFMLYKFRTMRTDAEKEGPQWAKQNDNRITFLGRILRYTHLDELPQLWNIFKGDLSFVGPRPERPEFVNLLKEKIPCYETRHLIKPGVAGWAQINYRYGSSIEDAYKKLEYDIYYLKNRSFILDAAIILKTIRLLFINQK